MHSCLKRGGTVETPRSWEIMLVLSLQRVTTRLCGRKIPSPLVAGYRGAAEEFRRHTVLQQQASYKLEERCARRLLATMPENELNKRLVTFQDLFIEARDCIEDVVDASETTYFDDDAEAAKEAVSAAVNEFDSIIKDIEDLDQKNRVLRSNGLKVEQLKGELEMAIKGGHH